MVDPSAQRTAARFVSTQELAQSGAHLSALAAENCERTALALVAERDADKIPLLQSAARERGWALCGAVVPKIVVGAELRSHGALLALMPPRSARRIVALASDNGRTRESAIDAIAQLVDGTLEAPLRHCLWLFVDATIPDVASMIERVYARVGDDVNYSGVCVGSETFSRVPCVFDETMFVEGAALAVVLRGHPAAACVHHYAQNETVSVATATSGSSVSSIDGIPAFERYQQIVRSEYGVELDRESFYRYAVHFPFALTRARGEPLVRIPVRVDERGAVQCVVEIRENALLGVVRAVEPGALHTVQLLAAATRGADQRSMLCFYCAGRTMHLGDEAAARELRDLGEALDGRSVFGALCLGEIASGAQQFPAFHNGSIVVLPWR